MMWIYILLGLLLVNLYSCLEENQDDGIVRRITSIISEVREELLTQNIPLQVEDYVDDNMYDEFYEVIRRSLIDSNRKAVIKRSLVATNPFDLQALLLISPFLTDSLSYLVPHTKGNLNWNTSDPCVDGWFGITCDVNGYVTKIDLTG